MKVLIVDPDQNIVRDLVLCLKMRYSSIEAISVPTGLDGIENVEAAGPDFVIISFPLPEVDSGSIIAKIREFSDIPIVIFSGTTSVAEKARFLEAGADEFISKPVNCIECLSIVNALLRRTFKVSVKQKNIVSINERVVLNYDTRELTISGCHTHMTPFEYHLLAILVRNSGLVLSYKTLLEKVWGPNYTADVALLKKYIYTLRSKIEQDPRDPKIITTERGYGYKLSKVLEFEK